LRLRLTGAKGRKTYFWAMYTAKTLLRVRYGETDRMGLLYHAHYATYYEVGRTESIRQLGLSYRSIEDAGVLMPVTDMSLKFLLPLQYDEEVQVISNIPSLPEWRMVVQAELRNQAGELVNQSEVRLAFLDAVTKKVRRAPDVLLQALEPFFP
jgi:acyl-CoA thioester hydrolase